MFRGKNKDIGTRPTSSVSLVDFKHVNVYLNVIKRLLNDFWPILKMLCSNVIHAHQIPNDTML